MKRLRLASRLSVLGLGRAAARRRRRARSPFFEPMEDRTLLSSGQLDPSFGYQGIVPLTYAANDIISDPDGRFLVSGTGANGGGYFPYVQRYTADGQLDPTFGTLGTASDSSNVFAANLGGFGVGLEPDGKIVQSVQYNVGAQLVRYNPDGTADLTFGTSGATAPLDISVNGQMDPMSAGYGGIAVLPDGRILMAGDVGGSIGLALYRTDGTLDPSFNGTGTLVVTPDPTHPYSTDDFSGVAVEDGKILLQVSDGTADGAGISLYRFHLDGSADATFGVGGVVGRDVPGGSLGVFDAALAVQPDGRIVVGYHTSGPETITRFNTDGSPDQSFGTGGSTTFGDTINSLGIPQPSDIAMQPDGKIAVRNYVATGSGNGQGDQPEVERLNADGSVDVTFGNEGIADVSLPQYVNSFPSFITVQPSGRIILALGTGGTSPFQLVGVVGDPVVGFDGATSVSTISGTSTAEYDASETAGTATVTLRRGGDLSQPLTVPFSTDDSGGRAGINYTSIHTTVTFAVGSETATVAIPLLDDPNASAPVDVPLVLGTPSAGAILGDVAAGDLHIIPVEGIIISPTQVSSVMQGGAGSTFTVALTSVPTGNVTVPLSISTTNPAATLSSSSLTFTPANALTPQTVTVTAAGGSGTSPAMAMATVTVGPATSGDPKYRGLTGDTATVEVYPAGTSGAGSIEFAAGNFAVDEDAGTATITLVRLGGSTGSVSVHFATSDGTYGAAGKYTPLSGSVSFAAGVTSKTVTINLIDPGHNLQGDQTVDLTLSNPAGGARLGVFPTATLTLHDLARRVAGDLDPAFGSDGESLLLGPPATASAIASQPDGKLVIAGTGGTAADGTALVRVWRTDASGRPDPGFGQQGLALIPFANFVQVKGVAIDSDGGIVVVGTATKPAGGNEFALLRLNADGSLDTGFGDNGLVTTSFSPGDDSPVALFVEDDGSIFVAGTVDTAGNAVQPFAFAHYGPDGSVDLGFGSGGAQVIPAITVAVSSVLQQPDGKWLLIGGGGYDASEDDYLPGYAVRLDPDFTPDASFGTAGVATMTWSEFYFTAALQPDGKILVGGGYAENGLATLGRLNVDGSPDTTFGSGGSVSTPFEETAGGEFGVTSSYTSVLVEPGGKIVAVGGADGVGSAGAYFTAEARYLSDGSLDPTFADGGSRSFSLGGGNDSVAGAVAQSGGDVVIAGTANNLPVLASVLTVAPGGTTPVAPTITWANPASIAYGTALGASQLDATSNVPGTFTYSPAAGTILGAGNGQVLTVTFTPDDAADFTTATATATIGVAPAAPTITWADPADIVAGAALGPAQLDATASVPGTFTYSPAPGTILAAGAGQALTVTFTPADATDYATATAAVTINVDSTTQTTPTIVWATPAAITEGTPLGPAQLDATASVPGTFTYSPPAGTILSAGVGQTLFVQFTPFDAADFTAATAVVAIDVEPSSSARTTPVIAWARPADIIAGTPLGVAQLDATASVPGLFTYSPEAGTILGVGAGQPLSVIFTPIDTTDYTIATGLTFINVLVTPLPTSPTPTPTLPSPTPTSSSPTPPQINGTVGTSRTSKGLTTISLGFDQVMDGGSITNPAFYQVLGAVKKHRKTVFTKTVRIQGISFDGNSRVTIKLARPFKGAVKVTIDGLIQAADGGADNVQFSTVVG